MYKFPSLTALLAYLLLPKISRGRSWIFYFLSKIKRLLILLSHMLVIFELQIFGGSEAMHSLVHFGHVRFGISLAGAWIIEAAASFSGSCSGTAASATWRIIGSEALSLLVTEMDVPKNAIAQSLERLRIGVGLTGRRLSVSGRWTKMLVIVYEPKLHALFFFRESSHRADLTRHRSASWISATKESLKFWG